MLIHIPPMTTKQNINNVYSKNNRSQILDYHRTYNFKKYRQIQKMTGSKPTNTTIKPGATADAWY